MPHAPYDTYDYPGWWEGRELEHKAEASAVVTLLEEIPKRRTIIDVGAGFGRLTPTYAPFFSKITLVDPSGKLLSAARDYLKDVRGVEFIEGRAEKLPPDLESFDVALVVRILHHFENPEVVVKEMSRVLRADGFLILEFANKIHRPKRMMRILENEGFEAVKILSVSNLHYKTLKKLIPLSVLIRVEEKLQEPLARFWFGSSIFILAQKVAGRTENIIKPLEL